MLIFFQDSRLQLYQGMSAFVIENGNQTLARNNSAGIEGVKKDPKYAFIMESPMAEYEVNTDCSLVTIGDYFRTGYYGFAFQRSEG